MEKATHAAMILAGIMLAGLAILTFVSHGARAEGSEGLKTVDRVELDRYLGRWYEIAHIPASCQKDCAGGTTATDTLRDDGDSGGLNQCYKADGELKKANGRAWVVDTETNARLKVTFVPWIKLSFLSGDYWVIDLGPDYEYAVVGHPSRTYGWVLSRTPELSEKTLSGIKERLAAQGYDWSRFEMTNQKDYGPGKGN